ncbi:MAG TPA: AAA family ATPase [Planctomycetaceae bacterium]|nr:AAA family ATPase [Planctomycetaceae bacterium]
MRRDFVSFVESARVMYEDYWQLTRPAFRAQSPGEGYFPAQTHRAARLKLRYLIEQKQPAALMVGDAGVGKSFLIDAFLSDLGAPAGPIATVLVPQLQPNELVGYLVRKLGDDSGLTGEPFDHSLLRWEACLETWRDAGRHPVIVIDDAQTIEDRHVWQTLQLLLNYRHGDTAAFSLILCGQPELVGQIGRCPALHDRLAFTCALQPFSLEETAGYVRHRLQLAGASSPIFDEDAIERIHHCTRGFPRRINRLCDFALLVGFADQLEQIATEQVDAVAEELQLAA